MYIINWFWNSSEFLMILGIGIIVVGIIVKKKNKKN